VAFFGRLVASRSFRKLGLATALIVGVCVPWLATARDAAPDQWVRGHASESHRKTTVAFESLPPEAKATSQLIRRGGPFPYAKDGIAFGNRERLLPMQRRGYYREYTVRSPGAKDRGAQRIVCGGQPTAPEACYYTNNHYASFRRIVQ
jgi:ribonuclease T1